MKKTLSIISLVLALSASSNAAAEHGQIQSKAMKFKNPRGSMLTLIKHGETNNSGSLTGTFSTAVASSDCQQVIGKPVPVKGFFVGNSVTITASFPECGAVISFVGNLNGDNLETLWIDAHQANKPAKQNWNNKFIGHDKFKKIG